MCQTKVWGALQWRHKKCDGVAIHQPHYCLNNRLFKAQIKENIKAPHHWPSRGEFIGDFDEFPTQRASNANQRHHPFCLRLLLRNYISCIIPYFKGPILHNQWWIIQIVEVIVWQMVNIFFITLAVRFTTVPDLFQLKGNKADNYITCYSLHKTRTICVAQCQNLDVNLRCIVQQILSYTGNSDQIWFITGESNLANNLDYHRNSVAARQDVGSSGYGLVNIAYYLNVLSNNDFLTTKSGVLWYTPVVYASIV